MITLLFSIISCQAAGCPSLVFLFSSPNPHSQHKWRPLLRIVWNFNLFTCSILEPTRANLISRFFYHDLWCYINKLYTQSIWQCCLLQNETFPMPALIKLSRHSVDQMHFWNMLCAVWVHYRNNKHFLFFICQRKARAVCHIINIIFCRSFVSLFDLCRFS